MEPPRPLPTAIATTLLAVGLACAPSCVAPPQDGHRGLEPHLEGPADREEAWEERPDDQQVQRRTDELLAEPLDKHRAVEVALLNHPGLQADIHRIDVAEGRLRQQARIPDPQLELETYFASPDAGPQQLEPAVMFDVAWLFDRAATVAATGAGIETARIEAAHRIVEFITGVRRAWVDHVADLQRLARVREVAETAEAIAESAREFYEAGNIAADELQRLEADAARAELEVLRAEEDRLRSRRHLHDKLGIEARRTDWSVPDELPELPDQPPDVADDLEGADRRALQARRHEQKADEFDARRSLERRRGWLPTLGVGAVAEIEDDTTVAGPAVRLGLPLFDRRTRMRDALEAQAIQADLEGRQALRQTRLAAAELAERLERTHETADHYRTTLIPLRQQLIDRILRQYNAMAVSALEVLETRREHLEARRDYVEAKRQFWQTRIDVDHLLAGGRPDTR